MVKISPQSEHFLFSSLKSVAVNFGFFNLFLDIWIQDLDPEYGSLPNLNADPTGSWSETLPPSIYSCELGLMSLAGGALPCPLSLLMSGWGCGTWDSHNRWQNYTIFMFYAQCFLDYTPLTPSVLVLLSCPAPSSILSQVLTSTSVLLNRILHFPLE